MKRRLDVSAEVKRTAVARVAAGEAVSDVAVDLGVDRRRVYEWQEVARRGGLEALRYPMLSGSEAPQAALATRLQIQLESSRKMTRSEHLKRGTPIISRQRSRPGQLLRIGQARYRAAEVLICRWRCFDSKCPTAPARKPNTREPDQQHRPC